MWVLLQRSRVAVQGRRGLSALRGSRCALDFFNAGNAREADRGKTVSQLHGWVAHRGWVVAGGDSGFWTGPRGRPVGAGARLLEFEETNAWSWLHGRGGWT